MEITLESLKIKQGAFSLCADFSIGPNQTTAVIGPSGGGKSTLLLAIAGFVAQSSGRVMLGNTDHSQTTPAKRPISMMFQDNNLLPHLSVFRNVALGVRPDLKLNAQDREQVKHALSKVGLAGFGAKSPHDLSGGERQRVALARMMLRQNPVWLLDEPFTALGPAQRVEMLDLFERIRAKSKATLVMVTHNPEDARRIAADTIVVADGCASPPHATKELLENPPAALRD